MACASNYRRLESASIREGLLRCGWDVCDCWIACCEAIAATVWKITDTSDDQDGTGKIVGRPRSTSEGQQLADGDWFANGISKGEDVGVKITRRKEVGLHTVCVTIDEVAVGGYLARAGMVLAKT